MSRKRKVVLGHLSDTRNFLKYNQLSIKNGIRKMKTRDRIVEVLRAARFGFD